MSDTGPGGGPFEGCSALKSVSLPDSLTYIGNSAFANCESLEFIKIPDNVTTIGFGAFQYCSSLTKVDVPKSLFIFEQEARGSRDFGKTFLGCNNLKDIYLNWDESTLDEKIIPEINNTHINGLFLNQNTSRKFVNKTDATIHLPSNTSSSLLKKYQDNFKEYVTTERTLGKGIGLDSTSTKWVIDKEHKNIWPPLMGGIFGGIVFSGLATGGIVFYKKKHNKKNKK